MTEEQTATTTNSGEQEAGQQTATEQATTQASVEQTPEQASAEQQPKEGAPEVYEFKAAEGQTFDPEFLKSYSEVARELNLTQEAAQTMIDKVGPVLAQQQQAQIAKVRAEWAEASKVDAEFGGAKFNENLAIAKQSIDKFATPEFKQMLDDTGLGNHPEWIRYCYRVSKAFAPDNFEGGHKEGGAAPKDFNSMASKLYPGQK
jgi:hypothetical protein